MDDMALTGSPESAEATLELTRAIRTLNVPVLLIDHISKAAIKGEDDMAFGSVYTEYSSRLAWQLNADEFAVAHHCLSVDEVVVDMGRGGKDNRRYRVVERS